MSVRDLQDSIKKAQRIIQEWDDNNRDPREDETRRELIDPVLMALGWPVKYGRGSGNRKPCITEYYPYEGSGLRVDYAMFDDGDNEAILVEAKRFSEHTKDHYVQLVDYCEEARDIKAVLTNGEYWNVVVLDQRGRDQEEKPISLMWHDSNETAERLYAFLSRDNNRANRRQRLGWKR